ncbi:MAG: DNA polymerase III subunit delta [Clostridiales bacterium]|nr:DNA polymerase III subunit delta [Clostridiales bacterium]
MKTITEDIRRGQLRHVYLLYGEETYLIRQYKNNLKDALSAAAESANTARFEGRDINPKQVIELADTMPFFSDHRSIFIDNSGFLKKSPEELASYMEEIPESTYFVFTETEVDRRCRLYKQIKKQGRAVEFKRQGERVLTQWILGRLKKENKKISQAAVELFLTKTGNDMDRIDQELEKLLCYTMDREVIGEEDVEAVSAGEISGRIFEMVDAIAGRHQKRALELYYDLLMLKEPPMRILILITRQFQRLLHIKELSDLGFDRKTIASKVGVPEFAVRKNIGQAEKFSRRRLLQAVEDGVQAEEDVKSGRLTDRLAVELYLMTYSGGEEHK